MFLALVHEFLQVEVAVEVIKGVLVVNRRVLAVCTPRHSSMYIRDPRCYHFPVH